MKQAPVRRKKQRGTALITTFLMMSLIAVAGVTYIQSSTQSVRISVRQTQEVQLTHVCEAGIQSCLRNLWRPFKINQNFTAMDDACTGASSGSPHASIMGDMDGTGKFSAGVIAYSSPNNSTYERIAVVRAVAWIDSNNDNVCQATEPQKIVDVSANFRLSRSQVFDYTYFVNNYGWMDGFSETDLIVNGDMRANGNFNFSNGVPTINGSVIAANNDKLSPPAAGLVLYNGSSVNAAPVKWTNTNYSTQAGAKAQWRQAYDATKHGARGSSQYELWRDFIFDSDASIQNNRLAGAAIQDASGARSWSRTTTGTNPVINLLDQTPTEEVVMPDLSDLNYYQNLSANYIDTKATYTDGTANPNYQEKAWVKTWNTSTNSYQTITTNGVLTGSAALIGTSAHPIMVHGPVTFTQDAVITGYVQGQGTIYTGRNVHIVGSIFYKNPPDFRGNDMQAIDNSNEKKDMVALAARGSVIMGDVSQFTNSYPLQYMTPPFTHGRYDDNGNWIPPFDANVVDSTGFKKYQSVMGNSYIHSISSGINQMDAILYTNFVGGGNIGTGGGGVTFNGSIISKDEAMVVFSLPMRMNYDNRIRERSLTQTPLIDLQLPRSPIMLRSTWQDRGFTQVRTGG